MAGTSDSPYGGALWHHMDWLLRVDVAVLALLLACTVVLVLRLSRCYRLARGRGVDSPAGKGFVAELKGHVGNLKSIASTATYFGLLGTCLGILSTFRPVAMERHALMAWLTSKLAAALVPCAAGIIVAIAAMCGYTYGRTRLDLLVNGLPGRNRLLTGRFTGFPPFAIVAAWLLAIVLRVYVLIAPVHISKGFQAGIPSAPCDTSNKFLVLRIANRGGIFLNEEEQDWKTLQSRLSEIYRMRVYRVLYLSAEPGVPFQTVADAIDAVTSTPENITVHLVTPGALQTGCPEARLAGSSTAQPSR